MEKLNCTVFVPFKSKNSYGIMKLLKSMGLTSGCAEVYYNYIREGWDVRFIPCKVQT